MNLLNYIAGNVGLTVKFGADLDDADGYGAIEALGSDMDGGRVALVLVHEANPVYALPPRVASPGDSRRFRSRSLLRSIWMRPPRCATCCCRSSTPSNAGTISSPAAA